MRRLVPILAGLALALGLAASALAAGEVTVKQADQLGQILADDKSMTLYTFKKDTAGTSNCYDQCEQNWPPFTTDSAQPPAAPSGVDGTFALADRKDGKHQVTYNGMPLYYYVKDMDAEDTYGQGVGNVWYVVQFGAAQGAPAQAAGPAQLPNTGGEPLGPGLAAALAALGTGALAVGLTLRRGRRSAARR